jgi:hypothetical protein
VIIGIKNDIRKIILIEATIVSIENDINPCRKMTKKKWRRKIDIKKKE